MNKETLDKAIELQNQIKDYEKNLSKLEDFLNEIPNQKIKYFEFKFCEKDELSSPKSVELIYNKDEYLKEELKCCGMIVATYMREVINKKLSRLKEEYKNL